MRESRKTQDELEILIQRYSAKEAEGVRAELKKLAPRVQAYANKGKFKQA